MDCEKNCANYKARAYIKQKFEEHPELKEFGYDFDCDWLSLGDNWECVYPAIAIDKYSIGVGLTEYKCDEYYWGTDPAAACGVFWSEWLKIRPQVVLDWLNEALPGEGWEIVQEYNQIMSRSYSCPIISLADNLMMNFGHTMLTNLPVIHIGWQPFSKVAFIAEYRKQHPKEPKIQPMQTIIKNRTFTWPSLVFTGTFTAFGIEQPTVFVVCAHCRKIMHSPTYYESQLACEGKPVFCSKECEGNHEAH